MIAVKISADFKGQNKLHPDRLFNKRATELAERAALQASKTKALGLYQQTVRSWDNPPNFVARRTQAGWSIWVSDRKYSYLDLGTSVRYATMTKGFIPKTQVGVMYSYKGAGQVAFVNRFFPRPGIKARGWTERVNEEVGKIIRQVYREKLHANWINK